MSIIQINPEKITSLNEFISVFDVSIDEFITACEDNGTATELIETYNTYSANEKVHSLEELQDGNMNQLIEEIPYGQEYSLMVEILHNRNELYICDMSTDVEPHRFTQISR